MRRSGAGSAAYSWMRLPRRAAAVIARHQRDGFDLVRVEAAQIAVLDQVVRVPVMARRS